MALQLTTVMLGVDDLQRSKKFYADLGCTIEQDYPNFVSLGFGTGPPTLALYPREAAAQDAGVSPESSGFWGASFHYIVQTSDAVDEVIQQAVSAGASVVKEPAPTQWGYASAREHERPNRSARRDGGARVGPGQGDHRQGRLLRVVEPAA